jgi:HSP20 family protein
VTRKIRTIRLRRLEGQIGEVAYQITKIHFQNFREPVWRPASNVFECASCFRICVELAGIVPDQIEILFAPGRLQVQGFRSAPEPDGVAQGSAVIAGTRKSIRVQTMEINYGRFEREFRIPSQFDLRRISTEWENGLLWISLPAKSNA